jgi:predicted Rossmann-fold nucleotide-binding protein
MSKPDATIAKLPVVGVMGDGKTDFPELTAILGAELAASDVHLLTGAGLGTMTGVARAFTQRQSRKGLSIGIVPARELCCGGVYRAKDSYPNPFVELAIYTHLPGGGESVEEPLTRNHINILSSDFVIILPGGPGTALEEALTRCYGKPFFKLLEPHQISTCIAAVKRAVADLADRG